jgi:hypothetical protein
MNENSSPRRRLPDPGQGKLIKELSEKMEQEVTERVQVWYLIDSQEKKMPFFV